MFPDSSLSAETGPSLHEVEQVFSAHYPAVVGISGKGEQLLFRKYKEGKFSLVLENAASKPATASQRQSINSDRYGQFSPRFSKDQKFLYYFTSQPKSQDFRLILRKLDDRSERTINPFPSASPKADLSHDNRYFALVTVSGHLALIDLQNKNQIVYESPAAILLAPSFSWSNLTHTIYYVSRERPSEIVTYNLDSRITKIITLPDKPSACSWRYDQDSIISATVSGQKLELFEDEKSLNLPHPLELTGDITALYSSFDNQYLVFGYDAGFLRRHIIYDRTNATIAINDGYPLALDQARNLLYLTCSVDNTIDTTVVNLGTGTSSTLNHQIKGRYEGIAAEEISIQSEPGPVPGMLWKKMGTGRSVILALHGGPRLKYQKIWTPELELVLNHGIDVFQLNFHGSSGYGSKFANQSGYWVSDAERALNYLARERGYKNIFVHGESTGGSHALKLTREANPLVSGLILSSFLATLDYKGALPKRTLVIQGANDFYCNAECARARLTEHWTNPGDGWLKVVEGEGHNFQSVQGRSRAISSIIRFIGNS